MKSTTNPTLTKHAEKRMNSRRISREAMSAVLEYGRIFYVRGAKIYAIGKKEVQKYKQFVPDIQRYEGLQIVCTPEDTEHILTTYRNSDFSKLHSRRRGNRKPAHKRDRLEFQYS